MGGDAAFVAEEPRDMSRLQAELAAGAERADRAEALLRNAGEEISRMAYHVEQLHQELAEAKCDLAKSREEAAAATSLATALGTRTADLDHEVVALREKSYQLELEAVAMLAEQDRLRAELGSTQGALDEAVAARNLLTTQLGDASQQQARNAAAAAAAEELYRAEVQQLQVRLAASEAECRAVQHARGTLLDDLQRARGDILALQGQLKEESRQKELLASECRRLQRELEIASEGLHQAQRAQRTTAAGAVELETEVERLRSGRQALEAELQATNGRNHRLQEENRQLTERNNDLINQLHGLSSTVRHLESENARLTDGHATLRVEAEARAAEVRSARGEAAELAADRARLMAELQAVRPGGEDAEVGRLQAALSEARAEVARLREEVASNDVVLAEAESALVALVREKEGLEQQLGAARAAERRAGEAGEELRAQLAGLRAKLGAAQAVTPSASVAAAAGAVLGAETSGHPNGPIYDRMIKYLESLDAEDPSATDPSDAAASAGPATSPCAAAPATPSEPVSPPAPPTQPNAPGLAVNAVAAARTAAIASSSAVGRHLVGGAHTSGSGPPHLAYPQGGPNADAWGGASATGWGNNAGLSVGDAAAVTSEVLLFPPGSSPLASVANLEPEPERPAMPDMGRMASVDPAGVPDARPHAPAAAAATAAAADVGPSSEEPASATLPRPMGQLDSGEVEGTTVDVLRGDGGWPAGQQPSLSRGTPGGGQQDPLHTSLEALPAVVVVTIPAAAVEAKGSDSASSRILLRTSPGTNGHSPAAAPERLTGISPKILDHASADAAEPLAAAASDPTNLEHRLSSPLTSAAMPASHGYGLTTALPASVATPGGELQEMYSTSSYGGQPAAWRSTPSSQLPSAASPAASVASAATTGGTPATGPYTDHNTAPPLSTSGGEYASPVPFAYPYSRPTDTSLLSSTTSRTAAAVVPEGGSVGPQASSVYRLSPLLSNVMLRGPTVTSSSGAPAAAADAPGGSDRSVAYKSRSSSLGGIGPTGSPMISPRIMLEARMLSRAVRPSAEALASPLLTHSATPSLGATEAPATGLAPMQQQDLVSRPSMQQQDLVSRPSMQQQDLVSRPSMKQQDLVSRPSMQQQDLVSRPSMQQQDLAPHGEAASLTGANTLPLLQALASQQLARHHMQQPPLTSVRSRAPGMVDDSPQQQEPSAFFTPVASDIAAAAAFGAFGAADAPDATGREVLSAAPVGPDASANLVQLARRMSSEQTSASVLGLVPSSSVSTSSAPVFRGAVSIPYAARQPYQVVSNAVPVRWGVGAGGNTGQTARYQLQQPAWSSALGAGPGSGIQPELVAAAVSEPMASHRAQAVLSAPEGRGMNEADSLLAQRLAAMDEALRAIGAA